MENIEKKHPKKESVHKVLAHSYVMYFVLFLVGICLDFIYEFKTFKNPLIASVGLLFLLIGTFLVVWAQKTSRHLKIENINKETFMHGPYRFTRTPTNLGLLFLTLGFGMIINASFVISSAFISFLIAKFYFLKKQEDILASKYGAPYLEYKKSVKF